MPTSVFAGITPTVGPGTNTGQGIDYPANATDGNVGTGAAFGAKVVGTGTWIQEYLITLPGSVDARRVTIHYDFGALSLTDLSLSWGGSTYDSSYATESDPDVWTTWDDFPIPPENNLTWDFGENVAGTALTVRATRFRTGLAYLGSFSLAEVAAVEAAAEPVAAFSGTPLLGVPPLSVVFTDESTGSPTDWDWDFGDTGTSTDQNPTHEYAAAGVYTVSLTVTSAGGSDTETKVAYVTVLGQVPGVWIDWDDDGFGTSTASDGSLASMMPEGSTVTDDITSDVTEFSWQRGGTADLAGGSSPGSCTIIVKNATKTYNPDNTASALYGKLRPGRPVWIGVNGNGSMVETAGQTVYGVFAGRIREIAPRPLEQVTEIICDDPLASYRRVPVRLADSTTRSQAAYRAAIMAIIGEPAERLSLPAESAMLPLSSLDTTNALAALDELDAATGTRHYAQPSPYRDIWYVYTGRDRNYHLGDAPDAAIDFGSDHVVSVDGWRVTDETVINVQKTTLSPVTFPLGSGIVWMQTQVPFTVAGNLTLWAEFADYVVEPTLEVTSSGAAVASSLTSFGATAKIELYSTGAEIQRLVVVGKLAIREPSVSYVAEDGPSKAAYGSRAGGEITSDLFGSQAEAKGLADHTIWRFAQPLKRPAITLRGAPVATAMRELYDMVSVTSSALSVSARRFDIVGISGTWRTATADVSDFEVTWQLSESPLQTSRIFFTIGVSLIDGPDVIAY